MNLAVNKNVWTHALQRCGTIHPSKHYINRSSSSCMLVHRTIAKHKIVGVRIMTRPAPRDIHPLLHNHCCRCNYDDLRVSSNGQQICERCGYICDDQMETVTSFAESHGPAYNQHIKALPTPRKHSSNIHKRLNHFKYWVARLQGKERSNITSSTLEQIRYHLQRYNIRHPTYDNVREALKANKLQRYYNNTYSIIKALGGDVLFDLNTEHEQQLVQLFLQIQRPYASITKRANMLSYPYLIRKFAELLGWEDMAAVVPILKCPIKNREQDKMWKRICSELGWCFSRSV